MGRGRNSQEDDSVHKKRRKLEENDSVWEEEDNHRKTAEPVHTGRGRKPLEDDSQCVREEKDTGRRQGLSMREEEESHWMMTVSV